MVLIASVAGHRLHFTYSFNAHTQPPFLKSVLK